jgi:hypothetical protein
LQVPAYIWAITIAVIVAGFWAYPYWAAYRVTRVTQIDHSIFTPSRLKPYRSLWIRSEQEFRELVDGIVGLREDPEGYWREQCDRFEQNVRSLKPDFETESVVLVPTDGHSSDTRVGLSRPYLLFGRLVCSITVEPPYGAHLTDIRWRCFAIVVRNDSVREVEVWNNGVRRDLLTANP